MQVLLGTAVWIVDSPVNGPIARQHRKQFPADCHSTSITVFKSTAGRLREDTFLDEFSTIDLHHGRYSSDPPYSQIEIFGAAPTPEIESALAEKGFVISAATGDGFIATRKA